MDPSTQNSTEPQKTNIQEDTHLSGSVSDSGTMTPVSPPKDASVIYHTKNLYPTVRHTILILVVIFCIALIVFLMHQNGKSIYDNGI